MTIPRKLVDREAGYGLEIPVQWMGRKEKSTNEQNKKL